VSVTRSPKVRGARGQAVRSHVVAAGLWLLPVIVIVAIYFSPRHIASPQTVLTGAVALGIVALATRRPDISLLTLIVFFPFQGLVLAKLWALGIPASVVSHLGAWKESLALGVIFAGLRSRMARPRPLDLLDRLALGFVALTALYAVLQTTIVPGAPSTSSIRLLGFRETAGFVLLLFGARHASLGPNFLARAAKAVFWTGAAVAAVGVYEEIDSSGWNHFVVHTVKYTQYQQAVLHTTATNPDDIRTWGYIGSTKILRVGSVFLDSLSCAWYLIFPFAIGIERIVRRLASPLTVLITLLIATGLLLTETRSAILGGLIVALLALIPAFGRPRHWRTQVAIVLGALVMVGVPAAFASGLAGRVASISNKSNQSTAGHISGFWSGIDTAGSNPLGLGLGTGAGTGQRYNVTDDQIPENNYLEVTDELGIIPGIVFTLLTIVLIVDLRRASMVRKDLLITAAWSAGIGLAVAAWFLQTWSEFAVSWTYWGLAGAALGLMSERVARAPDAAPVQRAHEGVPATTLQSVGST
jgi:hypothetical protein